MDESVVSKKSGIELKSRAEIALMKRAGEVAGRTLVEVSKAIEPGITTKELDRVAEKFIRSMGAIPTFIGYRGYPATICASINEEVVHGIPGSRKLKEGDIVSIDVAATLDGYVGDTAKTYFVGNSIPEKTKSLVNVTEQCLQVGIDAMKVGNRLGDIGFAVQKHAETKGFGVVRDFVGHGIGRQMHEEPAVPNYGTKGQGLRLEAGMVLAIEPMITMGSWKVKILKDGWTVVTQDQSLAAHFEHSIALTEDGPIVLTSVE